MFGKTEWFRENSGSLAPPPRIARGWMYYGLWLAAIAGPATALVMRGQFPESAIWAAVSGAVFLLDLQRLRSEIRREEKFRSLHFIGDDPQPPVETEKYRLEIKS